MLPWHKKSGTTRMTDFSGIQSAIAGAVQDLANNLLADLLGSGPNQRTRLLRLHTPLGADLLLAERAQITEAIGPRPEGSPFAIELLALSRSAHIQPVDLIGQSVLLELLTAHSRAELRPFHGHVLGCELLGSDGGYARYRLQIGAWLDFLRHRTDAWIFQDKTVVEITEAVFADYAGQGALQPAWRWDLKDAGTYPRLSTLAQFNETDFDFLQRLWADNGLFCWFEHTGSPQDGAAQGSHTLVIANHNGAFVANAQSNIRFTQSGSALSEDSITQWHGVRRLGPTRLNTASFDYRVVSNHGASQEADAAHDQPMALVHTDQPGAYAFEGAPEAERLATVQLQALHALRKQFSGRGTVRTLAPATTFVLADHAEHDADLLNLGDDAARFVALSVTHRARNNLSADAKAGLQHLLGHALLLADAHKPQGQAVSDPTQPHLAGNDSTEPLYEARFTAQRASVPVRALQRDAMGALLHPKPTASGTQTALVVGLDAPVHTDRDGRIKVQFHWQRGQGSSHRLSAALDDNAPASDASGTWVRVGQSWSGANWGGTFIPRLGQEVIVAFVEGDIDRPVVIGSAYNGQGCPDAQGNTVAAGAAQSTGNAPAWFPGSQRQGEHEGHAHTATLSGFKSQSLDASQSGYGAYNQLVLDDSPAQGRVLAHTTQSQTWLQLGHLLQQNDNQRLAPRGHGLELHTQALGALRAGSGMHLSTHTRQGGTSTAQGKPMDTREAQSQLDAHAGLVKALSENAQTHLAKLSNEPAPDKLNAQTALQATMTSLRGTQGGASSESGSEETSDVLAISGGQGRIPAPERPDIVMSAAGASASLTPAHSVITAGQHATITTGQDTNVLAQRHQAWAVKDGISLFTRGEAKGGARAVQDLGMKLHAASGNVSVQAQSDTFTLTAEKAIDVQSTAANITITAPEKIVLNGGGGYVKIEGGNIEIGTSGVASFKAAMKELTGGGRASAAGPPLAAPQEVHLGSHHGATSVRFAAAGADSLLADAGFAGQPYRVFGSAGQVLTEGVLGLNGKLPRVVTSERQHVVLQLGDVNGAKLESLPHPLIEAVSSAADDEEHEDYATDASIDHAVAAASVYATAVRTALHAQHSEFLAEAIVEQLLRDGTCTSA